MNDKISEKTNVPVSLVLTIAGAVGAAALWISSIEGKAVTNEKSIDVVKIQIMEQARSLQEVQDIKVRLERMDTQLQFIYDVTRNNHKANIK